MSDTAVPAAETATGQPSKIEQSKDAASDVSSDVRDEVAGAATDVKDEAVAQLGNVKDEVKDQASDLLHQTRTQVASQADDGTQRFGEAFKAAGSELVGMAERSDQDGPMTHAVRQLGERATSMGDRYQQGGYRTLSDDVTRFARRSPGTFLLAAVAAGFVVGRIVRNADTKAITDAARPDSGSGASNGAGSQDRPAVSDAGPAMRLGSAGSWDPTPVGEVP